MIMMATGTSFDWLTDIISITINAIECLVQVSQFLLSSDDELFGLVIKSPVDK